MLLGPKLLKKNVRLVAVSFADKNNAAGPAGNKGSVLCLTERTWLSTQKGVAEHEIPSKFRT